MIELRAYRMAGAAIAALAFLSLNPAGADQNSPPLTIVSWGGSYTASQMIAYVNPYRERTDQWVRVVDYNGGLEEIEAQVSSLNVTWDVVDLGLSDAIRGCENDLLEKIDSSILPDAPDGTPASEDFLAEGLRECAIGQNVFSTVVGYRKDRYDNPPQSIADFFDLQTYPGRRGLRKNPRVVLEWALIADGVAPADVYDVLSTEEGVDRAFAKLDTIKREIVWWENAATPPELLAEGKVAMTQTYNGRIQAAIDDGADQAILWDGQVLDIELWAIPKGSRNKEEALNFIEFASHSERMAEQSRNIAYGPARESAQAMLSDEVAATLPTAETNLKNAIWSNHAWWAENQDRLNARFDAWRNQIGVISPAEGTAR